MFERLIHIKSIKGKLRAVIMGTTLAVLLPTTLAFVLNEAVSFRTAIREELHTLAGIIGMNTTAAITFGDKAAAASTLEALRTKVHVHAGYILTLDGEIFAKYMAPGVLPETHKLEPQAGQEASWDAPAALERLRKEARSDWDWDEDFEVVEPVLFDNEQIGFVVLQSETAELYSRLRGFLVMIAIITTAAMIGAVLLSIRLQRPVTDPILELASVMRRVSESRDYSLRAEHRTSDEIGQLTDGFNEMLSQIQKRDADLEVSTAELRDSNEDLKSFVYSAAHDLRAPLVNLRGFSGELVSALDGASNLLTADRGPLPEKDRGALVRLFGGEVKESLGYIKTAVNRMDALINAMLKLSRAGHRELKLEQVDANLLVARVLETLRHEIEEQGVTVRVGRLPVVVADPTALEQVFTNLLSNAMKYRLPGRQAHIEVDCIPVVRDAMFRVRDNGRGIAKDDLPKLFKMFRRVGEQNTQGEGVGLAYTKTIVRRLGGRIWCESEPGEGSLFSFTVLRAAGMPDGMGRMM